MPFAAKVFLTGFWSLVAVPLMFMYSTEDAPKGVAVIVWGWVGIFVSGFVIALIYGVLGAIWGWA